MKVSGSFDHLNALRALNGKADSYAQFSTSLAATHSRIGKHRTIIIRRELAGHLAEFGWAEKVHIANTNLTISFMKDRIGICFQFGNVSRTYADLLKLLYLRKKGRIDCGILLVPDSDASRQLGANYAGYDRLVRELQLFGDLIDCPTLVLGISS